MPSFSINHIAIAVKNVDESIKFYKKVLHLKEIENTASNSKTRWLSFTDGKQLHLIPSLNFEMTPIKATHFALETAEINTFIKHLEALNIEYSDWRDTPTKSYVRKDGIQQVYFQDPNGYWIEVNNDVK